MSDRVQDLTNHRKVAVACKNYTDAEIKKSEERILSIVARNNVDFIDHTDEATYRFTAPANAKLLMLQSIAGNSVKYSPSVASDSTTAYQKTIPSYSPIIDRASASMNILGGMSYKINQLFSQNVNTTYNGIIVSRSGNYMLLNGTATAASYPLLSQSITFQQGHKYLYVVQTISGSKTGEVVINTYSVDHSSHNLPTYIVNATYQANNYGLYLTFPEGASADNWLVCCNVFDLTADFGSGNEPSTVSDCATEYAKRGVNIYEYTSQQSAIRDTAPTSVVSKDSNNTTIDTLAIDSNIQALDGYGYGVNDTCYNYVDFNAKKFIKKVGIKTYSSQDIIATTGANYTNIIYAKIRKPNNYAGYNTYGQMDVNTLNNKFEVSSSYTYDNVANVGKILSTAESNMFWIGFAIGTTSEQMQNAINGLNLYYELATPVETDISQYLDGNEIEIEPNGTLSFESTYSAYVPSNVSYNGVIKHSLVTAIQHSRNGVVLETRLLPNSEAKYSWGITDGVRNTRVFCDDEGNAVGDGSLNVNNVDISTLNWAYNSNNSVFYVQGDTNIPSGMKTLALLISTNYTCYNDKRFSNLVNMELTSMPDGFFSQGVTCILLKNTSYTDATTFKNAMNGVPLFYEKNETDTETLDDFDYFFDCEEGDTFTLVNTEQLQCYATYSFLIKEEKSNE